MHVGPSDQKFDLTLANDSPRSAAGVLDLATAAVHMTDS